MRDGIPRRLPVPRKWQIVIETADRPADRGTELVVSRLREAVLDELKRDFPAIDRELLVHSGSEAPELFSPLEHGGALDTALISKLSPQMQHVLATARLHYEGGISAAGAIRQALLEHAEACVPSRRRQIREGLASEVSPSELNKVMAEFDRAVAAANLQEQVARFMKDDAPKPKRLKITPDEDLRGRPR